MIKNKKTNCNKRWMFLLYLHTEHSMLIHKELAWDLHIRHKSNSRSEIRYQYSTTLCPPGMVLKAWQQSGEMRGGKTRVFNQRYSLFHKGNHDKTSSGKHCELVHERGRKCRKIKKIWFQKKKTMIKYYSQE